MKNSVMSSRTLRERIRPWIAVFLTPMLAVLLHAQSVTNAPAAGAQTTAADRAWQELMQAAQPPQPPAEWKTNQPSSEELSVFAQHNAEMAVRAANLARAFYTNYVHHPKAQQARDIEYQLLNQAVQLGAASLWPRLQAREAERLHDPTATEDERFNARMHQVMRPFSDRAKPRMRPP